MNKPRNKAFLSVLLSVFFMVGVGVLIITIASIARAQGADEISWNPVDWGRNPILAALALAGAVQMIRLKWPTIDGPFRVAALSAGIGSVAGALLDFFNLLTVEPFAGLATPLGGITYGLALALFNATGIAVWNYFTGKLRPVTVNVSEGLVPLAFSSSQSPSPTDFVVGLVKNAVGAAKLPAAFTALAPLLAQLAQSEAVLTDDLRSTLQARVISVLRAAGLTGVDLRGDRS